jgi:ribonucleotide reductase beta subunit family protein with ferritin-like domain
MTVTHEVHLHDPQTLYRHWEDGQWNPWDIDLSADREQWAAMPDSALVSFVLGSLMVAEERITTQFSGLVGAHNSEEEATFLATQQVDEARHMQFYARFLPGFVAGYTQIHHDEHRHIAYGTWFLREAVAQHPTMRDVVRSTIFELLPAVAECLTPPSGADASVLGASAEDLRSFALGGLTRRLKLIGVALEAA